MIETETAKLYSGTSGLVLPVANKAAFPLEFQDKSRLTYYASIFNSIEINSSFYKVPMAKTVANWAESVPDNFKFTFKLWREITHNRGLDFKPEDVARFIQTIALAGTKKGCLLVQFPPSLTATSSPALEKLLNIIQEADPQQEWKLAIEFRNRSWYNDDVYQLLDQYKATVVLQDMPASATPFLENDLDFVYLRFHGPDGNYKDGYSDDFLSEYAGYIKSWQEEGKSVYVYFNNTAGDAIKNLMSLNQMVQQG